MYTYICVYIYTYIYMMGLEGDHAELVLVDDARSVLVHVPEHVQPSFQGLGFEVQPSIRGLGFCDAGLSIWGLGFRV